MLRLPRNLYLQVHQVLHLPRNLHFKGHRTLCLPRNLHIEVHQKCCTCHEICTSRFTKCCTCHILPQNLHLGSPSAGPATKSALRGSPSAAPATKSARRDSPSAVPATKSANEPHVQKSRFTAPDTKSELLDDHHHIQSAAPATKTASRRKTAPIPCTCHEKSTLEHQNTRFALHLPRKVTTMYQNAHSATTRTQSLEAPAAGPQILRACAVEMHIDDVERHECTVNSNEFAAHARALQRSKHQLPFPYRKNPSVCPHCLVKKNLPSTSVVMCSSGCGAPSFRFQSGDRRPPGPRMDHQASVWITRPQ